MGAQQDFYLICTAKAGSDVCDLVVDIALFSHLFAYFLVGVDNGGVVPSSESFPDICQGQPRHFPADVHGYLPGQGHVFHPFGREQVEIGYGELSCHDSDDVVGSHGGFFGEVVLEGLGRQRNGGLLLI